MARFKTVATPEYNLLFDRETGFLARWGATKAEDPAYSPAGPELADIEISTVCHGIGHLMASRTPCSWCYKSNTWAGKNMALEIFSEIFSKFPPTLTQIAFGIGDIDGNPDLWKIMEHTRSAGVIPNVTVNGMGITEDVAKRLAGLCGAVAVSHYSDDLCFDAIKRLADAGLKQVNIHKLLSMETLAGCFRLIDQSKSDIRLAGLKAIVFLLLKPKGNRNRMHSINSLDDYRALLAYAEKQGVSVGMDSCSAPMAFKTVPQAAQSIEPCESGLFSIYVNVDGEAFPCSFTEGTPGWARGIDVRTASDFIADIWNNPRILEWRERLMPSTSGCICEHAAACRACPLYDITICKPQLVKIKESVGYPTGGSME